MNGTLGRVAMVLLLAALGTAWFLLSFERVERSERTPPGPEASRHRFLAAERLLASFGAPVQRLQGLEGAFELPSHAAMLVPAPRGVLSRGAIERLDAFVAAGGHVLLETEPFQYDPLLERFGIRRIELDLGTDEVDFEDADEHEDHAAGGDRASPHEHDDCACDAHRHAWTVADGERPTLQVRLASLHALSADAPLWTLGDEAGARALAVAHGAGQVTALVDLDLFDNRRIGRLDHAEWLYRLLHDRERLDAFVVVERDARHFGRWLLDSAWRPLLVGALLLAMWIWMRAPRFGPIAADPPPVRRSLLDHLAACGKLLWSRGERRALALAALENAHARLRSEYPLTASMSSEALQQFLRARFGLDALEAQALLASQPSTQPLAFVFLLRACRRLHIGLTHTKPAADALFGR